MMVFLDVIDFLEVRQKKGWPVESGDNLGILRVDNLGNIAHCRAINNSSNVTHAIDLGTFEESLEQPKALIWAELCVPHHQERVSNVCVKSCHNPPHEVVYHRVVLILSCAVVCVKVHVCLPQTVNFKEVMQPADDGVGPLPYLTRLIREEVYLTR